MTNRFRVYWMRESGCDLGTPLDAADLDAGIRPRVLELAGGDERTLNLYLPFLDSRESRRRAEALRAVTLVREGDAIRSVPATAAAGLRDRSANLLAMHPAWTCAPHEGHPAYFPTWLAVSVAAQKALRRWIPDIYFREPAGYQDRDAAFPLLVYAASRPCRGRPLEFTYDVADEEALPRALYQIGASLQSILGTVERRLHECGLPALARRYAPRWHQDVVRAVQKKPRRLLGLLGAEAAVVNALVGLGSGRGMQAVKPFARSASMALRTMYGEDLRPLGLRLLDEATRTLEGRAISQSQLAA